MNLICRVLVCSQSAHRWFYMIDCSKLFAATIAVAAGIVLNEGMGSISIKYFIIDFFFPNCVFSSDYASWSEFYYSGNGKNWKDCITSWQLSVFFRNPKYTNLHQWLINGCVNSKVIKSNTQRFVSISNTVLYINYISTSVYSYSSDSIILFESMSPDENAIWNGINSQKLVSPERPVKSCI